MEYPGPPSPASLTPAAANLDAAAELAGTHSGHDPPPHASDPQRPDSRASSQPQRRPHAGDQPRSRFQQDEPASQRPSRRSSQSPAQGNTTSQQPSRRPSKSPAQENKESRGSRRGVQYGRVATPERYKDPLPDPGMDIEDGELTRPATARSNSKAQASPNVSAQPPPSHAPVSAPCGDHLYEEPPLPCPSQKQCFIL